MTLNKAQWRRDLCCRERFGNIGEQDILPPSLRKDMPFLAIPQTT